MKRVRARQQTCCEVLLAIFLLIAAGCGVNELLGRQEKKTIIEPCLELIPTPTPATGLGTPLPVIGEEPVSAPAAEPGASPTESPEEGKCANGPGQVLICDRQVLTPATFVIIDPPEIAIATPTIPTYTITATYDFPAGACDGWSMVPNGLIQLLEGASQSFSISVNPFTTGDCYNFNVFIDGSSIGFFNITTVFPSFTGVTSNHTIHTEFYPIGFP